MMQNVTKLYFLSLELPTMLKRRTVLTTAALATVPLALPPGAWPKAARTRWCWP